MGQAAADRYYDALFAPLRGNSPSGLTPILLSIISAGIPRSVCGVDSIYYRIDDNACRNQAISQSGHRQSRFSS